MLSDDSCLTTPYIWHSYRPNRRCHCFFTSVLSPVSSLLFSRSSASFVFLTLLPSQFRFFFTLVSPGSLLSFLIVSFLRDRPDRIEPSTTPVVIGM